MIVPTPSDGGIADMDATAAIAGAATGGVMGAAGMETDSARTGVMAGASATAVALALEELTELLATV